MNNSNVRPEKEETTSIVDLSYLTALCEGDQEFMDDMISSFVTDIPVTFRELKQQVTQGLWLEASRSAHQMKPAMQFMGLQQTLNKVKLLECYCKEESHLSELPELVSAIEHDIQTAEVELKKIQPTIGK